MTIFIILDFFLYKYYLDYSTKFIILKMELRFYADMARSTFVSVSVSNMMSLTQSRSC